MSTIIKGYNGISNNVVLLKGAPERVLEKCSKVMNNKGNVSDLDRNGNQKLVSQMKQVASEGLRVLGIAIALDGGNMKDITAENAS